MPTPYRVLSVLLIPSGLVWFFRYIFTTKVTLWATSYSACVVYTKTIIHLSVGE